MLSNTNLFIHKKGSGREKREGKKKAQKVKTTPGGLEPPTSALTVLRSNQLS